MAADVKVIGPQGKVQKEGLKSSRLKEGVNVTVIYEAKEGSKTATELKILKKQDPADLQARLQEVIGVGTPTLPMVQYWVSQARTCDMIEEYEPAASETSPSLLSQKVR